MQQQRNRFGARERRDAQHTRRQAHAKCLCASPPWEPACTLALAPMACRIRASTRTASVCVQPTFRAPAHASHGTHLNQFRFAAEVASSRSRNLCFSPHTSRDTLSARLAGPSNQGVASKPRRAVHLASLRALYRIETKRCTFPDGDPRPALLRRATARFLVRWHAPR